MKLISVIGSPNGEKGRTAQLVKCLLESAHHEGVETEAFFLADLTIHPCIGCEVCTKTGKCVIDDDMDVIKKVMIEADGIVLASPNYMLNVSAQMKAMIDRCFSMCHCQMMVGKYGAVVVTSGGPYTGVGEEYLMNILGVMGCWKVGSICAVKAQLDDEDERMRIVELAAHLGRRMGRAIREREIFHEQMAERAKFFEALKYLVVKQKENWPFEYNYWKSHWGVKDGKVIKRVERVGIGKSTDLLKDRSY